MDPEAVPVSLDVAFKEWAVVAEALGKGEQTIILRKGGIREGRGGFKVQHREFLLFPTYFHQTCDQIKPAWHSAWKRSVDHPPVEERWPLWYFTKVIGVETISSREVLQRLDEFHIWEHSTIEARFDWGREAAVYLLGVRVYRIQPGVEIPFSKSYGGCSSWVKLEKPVELKSLTPVLRDEDFNLYWQKIRSRL